MVFHCRKCGQSSTISDGLKQDWIKQWFCTRISSLINLNVNYEKDFNIPFSFGLVCFSLFKKSIPILDDDKSILFEIFGDGIFPHKFQPKYGKSGKSKRAIENGIVCGLFWCEMIYGVLFFWLFMLWQCFFLSFTSSLVFCGPDVEVISTKSILDVYGNELKNEVNTV